LYTNVVYKTRVKCSIGIDMTSAQC
jgi:hypothetical protein